MAETYVYVGLQLFPKYIPKIMKRNIYKIPDLHIVRYIFVSLLFALTSVCSQAQTNNNNCFDFPFKPGDNVWNGLSVNERINKLQIPEELVHNISTKDLLNICLDFPYLLDVFFADDFQKGFESLLLEFNGFKELMTRDDLLETTISKMEEMSTSLERMEKTNNIEKGRFSFKWFVLEMILAQDVIADKVIDDHLKLCINNLTIKKSHPSIFGRVNDVPTYLLLVKKRTEELDRI